MSADDRPPTLREALEACERQYLEDSMAKHGGNLSAVAREAGINRTALYRKLRRKGVAFRPLRACPRGNALWQALS